MDNCDECCTLNRWIGFFFLFPLPSTGDINFSFNISFSFSPIKYVIVVIIVAPLAFGSKCRQMQNAIIVACFNCIRVCCVPLWRSNGVGCVISVSQPLPTTKSLCEPINSRHFGLTEQWKSKMKSITLIWSDSVRVWTYTCVQASAHLQLARKWNGNQNKENGKFSVGFLWRKPTKKRENNNWNAKSLRRRRMRLNGVR